MVEEARSLSWVTPAKFVGPAMVMILLGGGAVAAWLAIEGRVEAAILTLLFAIGFLLVGIADLLGEIIILQGRGSR